MRLTPSPATFRLLAVCGLFCAAAPVLAQTPSPLGEWQYSAGQTLKMRFDPSPPKWDTFLGFGGEELPEYEGSNHYHFEPGPTIDIRYRNIAFLSTGEGLGVNVLHSANYRAGVALTYDLGRSEGTAYPLRGLGNLSASPAVKMFGEYVFFPVVVRGDVRYNIGGVGGWTGDISVYSPVAGNDHFFVFVGGTVTFADQNNLQHLVGVTAQESMETGDRVYTPGGGLASAGVGVNAAYIFSKHWFLDGVFAYSDMLGPAANSPVVESRNQFAVSLSLAYNFRFQ
jgi:outer membrane scaffolding protein for murein synthesis (MipA/OmpV family)